MDSFTQAITISPSYRSTTTPTTFVKPFRMPDYNDEKPDGNHTIVKPEGIQNGVDDVSSNGDEMKRATGNNGVHPLPSYSMTTTTSGPGPSTDSNSALSNNPLMDLDQKHETKVEEDTGGLLDFTPDEPVSSPPIVPEVKSSSNTPPPTTSSKKLKNAALLNAPVQDISHLPVARTEALSTFEELKDCHYQYNTLGQSREAFESMTCDCIYEHGVDDPSMACGEDSDCINRLTQVECVPGDCKCRKHCQNQRFQRKAYGNIEVVLTEKKGFGLRAEGDLKKDSFIYEYIGDVVSQPSFAKRMREYAAEGIRHFYFMMLQRDEFIDATKRGGLGRFANHSCRPNCYVAKWTVGPRVRMGIFAKRNVKKGEELTFDYNVDRYGHEAQPCYCGEPNCVGFIGGKTQTDGATVDDLFLDALGISDADRVELKGTKKKKGKKIDDPDFMPILHPIPEKDVPKVVQAIRQTQSKKVLLKLLARVKMTEDATSLRQIMRLRGFSVMTNILEDHQQDPEIVIAALECMMHWPLMARNKVDDSKVTVPVDACSKSENEAIKELANKLLAHWETLPSAYRIPKRLKTGDDFEGEDAIALVYNNGVNNSMGEPATKRTKFVADIYDTTEDDLREILRSEAGTATATRVKASRLPVVAPRQPVVHRPSVADIIAAATAEAEERKQQELARKEAEALEKEQKEKKEKERKERAGKTPEERKEERERLKEKQLRKLVAPIVTKCLSKHKELLGKETFKKHAEELTKIIADKEKKSSSYKENKLESLSDEKAEKMKKFAKAYVAKMVHKMKKKRQASSTGDGTPNSHSTGTGDVAGGVADMAMNDNIDAGEANYEPGDVEMEINGDDDALSITKSAPGSPTSFSDPRRRPPEGEASMPSGGESLPFDLS